MRNLNSWERKILQHLSLFEPGTSMSMVGFLNSILFKREHGRALIVDVHARYAMFFVDSNAFFDISKRKDEISKFLNLFSFLKYLAAEGYLSFHPIDKGSEKSVYYIQDSFGKTPVDEKLTPVILNDAGDCLSAADTILTKEKKPLSKGIIFEYEAFELITKTAINNFILTKSLSDFSNVSSPMKNQISKSSAFILGLILLTLFGIGGFFLYLHRSIKASEEKLDQLIESHKEIKSTLRLLNGQTDSPHPTNEPVTAQQAHYGIDVSNWNGNILTDLDAVDSISFVICKVTEGINYIDPSFSSNWKFLKQKGIIRGSYHFFHCGDDPIKQAEFFIKVMGQDLAEITPTVDIEQVSIPIGTQMTTTKIQVDLLLFLNHLERSIGRVPMIYTDEAFANQYLNNETFAKYPLWLAEYSNNTNPILPVSWKEKGFRIWQKSDSYSVNSRLVDFDVFFGELEELKK